MEERKRVIFFIEVHFNKRDYERFGIDTLINNGFEVEVWDFLSFLTNKAYQNITLADPIKWNGHRKFKDKREAVAAILALDPSCIIFSFLEYRIKTLAVYRAISKSKLFYCEQLYAYPISALWIKQSLSRKLARLSFERLLNRLLLKIPFKFLGVKPVDLRLINAEKFMRINVPFIPEGKILWTHNFDYDLFLRIKDNPVTVKERMGVFLDQYISFHSDFIYSGRKSPVSPEAYYGALCRFFDHLENECGLRIVIAAHPRSRYEDKGDLFGGREIIRGKTIELVRESCFVIVHNSASMNFAVLFKKPLIFLTSNKFIDMYNKGIIEPPISWLAGLFGKKAHNIDLPIQVDFNEEMVVNEQAYNRFKNDYIKKDGSEELPYWQIFANYIKQEHGWNK